MNEQFSEHEYDGEREYWGRYLAALEELSRICDPELNFYEEIELVRDEDREDAYTRLINTYLMALSTSDDIDDALEFVARYGLLESDS